MLRSTLIAAGIATLFAMPGAAKAQDADYMMRMVSECAYVVRIAEGNGVQLKNSSATWDQVKAMIAEQTGLATRQFDQEARAKWETRQRRLGARDAMRRLADRARDCDAQL